MDELNNLAQARAEFEILCQTFDNHQWKYQKNEEKLAVDCGAQGDDLPMDITVTVDADRMLVMLLSKMSFVIQEDKRLDVAIAVSAINNLLVDGSFDYNITTGRIFFRMTNSFRDSEIREAVFSYMLLCSFQTIDEYNDKFLMLAKGMLSIEKFLAALND